MILNLTRGNVLCEHVEIADTPLHRMRGLLGRRSLPKGRGLLLQPAPSIHTAFIRFEFDAVFLDGRLHVTKIVERIKPWRVVSQKRAVSVLQLAAGEASSRGVQVGDQVVVADRDVAIGAELGSSPASSSVSTNGEGSAATGLDALDEVFSEQESGAPRVLLVASDRRFRSVAAALLQRRGYVVTVGEQVSTMAEDAARERVDVVVLDAGAVPTVAALEAARFEAMNPSVGMVLVSDSVGREHPSTPVVPKWGSFEGLYDAIEIVRAERTRPQDSEWNGS